MAVATSVSASIGGAAAGSAGGAAAGAGAGGAAGGAGGGASVAVAPLILGAQRFSCSGGIALGKSDLQEGVAGNMGWATGEFDFLSPPPPVASGRLLTEASGASAGRPEELRRLLNLLISAAVGITLSFTIQLVIVCLWRHWINRRWQREQNYVAPKARASRVFPYPEAKAYAPSTSTDDKPEDKPEEKVVGSNKARKPAKFTAYPKSLVWPVPLFFACSMFVTGLTRASVQLLAASPAGCTASCTALAIGTLTAVATFLVSSAYFLVSFRLGAGRIIKFKPGATVPKPADPIMRLRARLRTFTYSVGKRATNFRPNERFRDVHAASRLTLKERGYRDRKIGAWGGIPEEDAAEPARTNRLLSHPFRFRHVHVGDGWNAREGFLMFRTNGKHTIGAYYRLFVLLVNVLFGVLSGLQPALSPGSSLALMQATVVAGLQLMMAILCCCATPDADRIVSTFAGSQFLCEATSTACLIFASLLGGSNDAGQQVSVGEQRAWLLAAFWAGLIAIFVPMTQLLEQRLVTPMIVLVEKGSGNPLVLAAQFYMLAVSLPRRIIRVVATIAGMEDTDADDAGADATADAGDDADANEGGGGGGDQQGGDRPVYTADQAAEQAARASKLLARATAAKEVSSRNLLLPPLEPAKNAPAPKAAPTAAPEAAPPPAPLASLVEEPEVESNVSVPMDNLGAGPVRVKDENEAADDDDADDDAGGD